ncbi:unnamed protein product [Amoebophrya sp. A120]|nr:unnamed protein product [Amoebophrya sp. A120]|eukprot:GSA120T00001401001.1
MNPTRGVGRLEDNTGSNDSRTPASSSATTSGPAFGCCTSTARHHLETELQFQQTVTWQEQEVERCQYVAAYSSAKQDTDTQVFRASASQPLSSSGNTSTSRQNVQYSRSRGPRGGNMFAARSRSPEGEPLPTSRSPSTVTTLGSVSGESVATMKPPQSVQRGGGGVAAHQQYGVMPSTCSHHPSMQDMTSTAASTQLNHELGGSFGDHAAANKTDRNDEHTTASSAANIIVSLVTLPLRATALTVGKAAEVAQIVAEPLAPRDAIPLGFCVKFEKNPPTAAPSSMKGKNKHQDCSLEMNKLQDYSSFVTPYGSFHSAASSSPRPDESAAHVASSSSSHARWRVTLSKPGGLSHDLDQALKSRGIVDKEFLRATFDQLCQSTIEKSLRRLEKMRIKEGNVKMKFMAKNSSSSRIRGTQANQKKPAALQTHSHLPMTSYSTQYDHRYDQTDDDDTVLALLEETRPEDSTAIQAFEQEGFCTAAPAIFNTKGVLSGCSTSALVLHDPASSSQVLFSTQLQLTPAAFERRKRQKQGSFATTKHLATLPYRATRRAARASLKLQKAIFYTPTRSIASHVLWPLMRVSVLDKNPALQYVLHRLRHFPLFQASEAVATGLALAMLHTLSTSVNFSAYCADAVKSLCGRAVNMGWTAVQTAEMMFRRVFLPCVQFPLHVTGSLLLWRLAPPEIASEDATRYPLVTAPLRNTQKLLSAVLGLTREAVDALLPPVDVIPPGTKISVQYTMQRRWSVRVESPSFRIRRVLAEEFLAAIEAAEVEAMFGSAAQNQGARDVGGASTTSWAGVNMV